MVSGYRPTTTVAPQALFLLNNPFVPQAIAQPGGPVTRKDGTRRQGPGDAGLSPSCLAVLRRRLRSSAFEIICVTMRRRTPRPRPNGWLRNRNRKRSWPKTTPRSSASFSAIGKRQYEWSGRRPNVLAAEVNPDEVVQVEAPVKEEVIEAKSPQSAAFSSFVQALLASAEFRFLK